MLFNIAAIASVAFVPKPSEWISPTEAVASVRHFLRCCDVNLDTSRFEVTKVAVPVGGRYRVTIGPPWDDLSHFPFGGLPSATHLPYAMVDSRSGDVVEFRQEFPGKADQDLNRKQVRCWLYNLGRGADFEFNPGRTAIVAKRKGYRFCNLTGDTKTYFETKAGRLTWFLGTGSIPNLPKGSPRISRSRAFDVARKALGVKRGHWAPKDMVRTVLTMFYDESYRSNRWVYEVKVGLNLHGEFTPAVMYYIDANTGKLIDNRKVDESNHIFHPESQRWYPGVGWTSSNPIVPVRLQREQVRSMARAELLSQRSRWTINDVSRTELTAFYDDSTRSSRWLWEVRIGLNWRGKFAIAEVLYIDAKTGRVFDTQRVEKSKREFQPRQARLGLDGVMAEDYRVPKLKAMEPWLKILGLRLSSLDDFGNFQRLVVSRGVRYQGSSISITTDERGRPTRYENPVVTEPCDEAFALSRSYSLGAALRGPLPTGSFRTISARKAFDLFRFPKNYDRFTFSSEFTNVYFMQSAFGYEVLDQATFKFVLNRSGDVALFLVNPSVQFPSKVPSKVLCRFEIGRIARELAAPFVGKDTPYQHNYAEVKIGQLGWSVSESSSGSPRLAYLVRIAFCTRSRHGTQSSYGTYFFDAETGKSLTKFPN